MICIGGVPVLKRHFGGAGPQIFYMIHRGGRIYVYVYIYVYIHTYMYMYIYIYMYIYMHTCMYIYAHIHISYARMCTYVYVYTYVYIYTYIYVYICIYLYIYIRIHTCACTHGNIYFLALFSNTRNNLLAYRMAHPLGMPDFHFNIRNLATNYKGSFAERDLC